MSEFKIIEIIDCNTGQVIYKDHPYDHIWFWKTRLPERKGQYCRILKRGRMNSVLVEFIDGFKVVTSRYAVRKTGR